MWKNKASNPMVVGVSEADKHGAGSFEVLSGPSESISIAYSDTGEG